MPIPLFVPIIAAGISAVSSLFGAKKQADSAKAAAKTQADSAMRGLAVQQQMYERGRADLAPYANAGLNAFAALNTLGGLPDPRAATAQAGGNTLASAGPSPMALLRSGQPIGARPEGWPAALGKYLPPDDQGGAEPAMTLAGLARPPQGQSGYGDTVMMRAPDGTTQAVPRMLAPHYQARGAQIVGA